MRHRPIVTHFRRCGTPMAILLSLVLTHPALHADDGRLQQAEVDRLVELLLQTEQGLMAALESTHGDAWEWKPAPDRWSVAQCAEHIVRTERALFDSALEALGSEASPDWREKTEGKDRLMERILPDRSGRAQAPEEVRPTEGLSRLEVMALFHRTRAEIAEVLADRSTPFHAHLVEHPFPVFGWLSAYEWILYAPLHTLRHLQQIEEVRATEGFPGG